MANENSKNKKQQNSESEILLAQIESLTKSGTWELDLIKNNLSWSDGVFQMLGYEPQEFEVTFEKGVELIHPDDRERATALMEDVLKNDSEYFIEKRLISKDGNSVFVRSKANIFKDDKGTPLKLIGIFQNISDDRKTYKNTELDKLEKHFMEESISSSESIQKVLKKYLQGIEGLFSNLNTSILSIEHNRLRNLMSPSLPLGLIEAIEGLPIGINQGSCGTAAYTKETIFVSDIFDDERWEGYTDLAKEYNFTACWSQPLINQEGNVIATFALYFKNHKAVQNFEKGVFDRTAKLISLVLQNFKYVERISQSQERFAIIYKATNNAIYDWNIVDDSIYWGDSLTRVFGHKAQKNKFTLQDWTNWVHPDDLDEVLQDLDIFMADQNETKWSYEYRFKDINGRFSYVEEIGYLIRGESGQPLRMIGALRDQTLIQLEKIKKELQQQISHLFRINESLNFALHYSLKYLTEYSNFSLGEIWLISQEQDCIRLISKYARTQSAIDFYDFELKSEFELGQGLPGKVWKENEYLQWEDINKKEEFLRKDAAKKTGLYSAIAYPLFEDKKVIGVILFAKETKIEDRSYEVSNFQILEKFLGEEIKRKQKEEELNLFFETAPENLVIANQKGYFVKVNSSLCNLLGYTKEELTSQPFMHFIHPEDLKKTQQVYSDINFEIQHPQNFTNRYRTKRGDYKWISWSSSESFGPDRLVFAFGRDVTETIELQQTVENATKLARVGGWEINQITGEHYWSPMTREIHEVPEDFTPNLDEAINFYHPDYQQIVSQAVEKAINNGESFDFEAIIISYRGNEKWVRAKGNAEFVKGQCVRLYGSFQDIHDRKITELRLENISNNVPGVIFQYHLKPDGIDLLDFVSKGSEEIFGYSPEECMHSTEIIWNRIEAGGDMPQMKNSIIESAKYLTPWHFIWRYQHPTGMLRYHEGSGNPRKLADGTVVWDSIIIDITELRELEILADRTAELAKIGSWELNLANGKGTDNMYWSPMTRSILGVDNNYNPTLTGGVEFYLKDSQQKIKDAVEKLINKGTQFDLELLIRTQKDKEKWIRCIGQAERIKGETVRIFGSFQDIDSQKKTELAVENALNEKVDILESISDAFFAVDNTFKVTYWNKEAEKILSTPRDEIINKNLWEVFHDAVDLPSFRNYKIAMQEQRTIRFEDYYAPLDRWFEINAYPSAKGLSVYFKDITLRKTADEKIKASNERFEKAAMATNDSIWDWDLLTNRTTRSGTGFENQFGYKAEKADKDPKFWAKHVHPEDLERITKSQERAIKDKKCNFWKENYRFKKKSDGYAYVVDKGFIVRDERGKAVRMIGATTDVTERKNYEKSLLDINEQLQKQTHDLKISNAELEQFAYVASHDLQEPLRMISGFLTQLEKKYGNKLDEKAHQYIDFAVDGAKRMRQIILDLLDFSRIGKEEAELVDVDLNEVVNEVCLLHRKKIDELNAKILFKDLPTIIGHPSPIIQLFQNLISNSLKYNDSKTPPKIVIKCKELKREWKFSIEDNGIGIDKAYYDKIFNIFQRLHNKSEYSGTGMGLAIVKKIIEKLNGKIWLESELGKGTTFYFTIPK